MSFRRKLFISHMMLSLVVAGCMYAYINHLLERRMIDESRDNLVNQAQLARIVVEGSAGMTPQKLARDLGARIKARVTLVDTDGRVTGDSDVQAGQISSLENHGRRPEIHQALNGVGTALRYSTTLRVKMLYAAVPYRSAAHSGIIRLALPLDYLEQAKESLHRLLVGALAALLLLSAALSMVLSAVSARPLRSIADAAARIGVGDRRQRIPLGNGSEIDYLARVLNEMTDRIEEQMLRLAAGQKRLNTILRCMGEGVVVTDTNGVIALVNPAFMSLFGVSGNVEGTPLIEVVRHPQLLESFSGRLQSEDDLTCEVTVAATNLVLLAHVVPLRGDDGSRQGSVAVFHDISELKRVETIRRDFVANVSHELRTPVAVIKGYGETLLAGALEESPERARHFIEVISGHANRLSDLINDILTLARLESHEHRPEQSPLEPCQTIRTACSLMADHAQRKGVALQIECHGGAERIVGSQGQLEQVLLNLLDNAVKYTPAGGSVRVSTAVSGGRLLITVADSGIGIPARDLPRIFERFYRVDGARSREQGGTGLGLAIVKHIVQQHGGEVGVSSEVGRGTSFTVSLPLIGTADGADNEAG